MATWLRMLGAEVGDGVYFDTIPPVETDRLVIKVSGTLALRNLIWSLDVLVTCMHGIVHECHGGVLEMPLQ